MLAGRVVRAKQAKRMGVVDALAPARQLRITAKELIKSRKQKQNPKYKEKYHPACDREYESLLR